LKGKYKLNYSLDVKVVPVPNNGTHIEIGCVDSQISTKGAAFDRSGVLHVATQFSASHKTTISPNVVLDRKMTYELIRLDLVTQSALSRTAPMNMHMPEIFSFDDGSVWIAGMVESGNTEMEVFMPIDANTSLKPRKRISASNEAVLQAKDEHLIRFVKDSWRKKPACIVIDIYSRQTDAL
jgi:hypothetical protein